MKAILDLIEQTRGAALNVAFRMAPTTATVDQIRQFQEGLLRPPRDPERRGQREHERLPWPRCAEDGVTPLGLDLDAHRAEIEAAIATVAHKIGTRMDFEAAVWIALGDRNHMPSAYDPRRGWSVRGFVAKTAYGVRAKLMREQRRGQKRARLEDPYQE